VLDGRDIGTVIAPEAPAKLFVSAAPEVRAERRFKQLIAQGETVTFDDILADIRRRDERDSGRAAAPLIPAPDAVLLDTSDKSISQAAGAARRIVKDAFDRYRG
jgi:cytidylate kinase